MAASRVTALIGHLPASTTIRSSSNPRLVSAMGLFDKVKRIARLGSTQTEEPSRELGDLIEPGSAAEVFGSQDQGSGGGATSLERLEELRASGLIDANTFDLIEKSMTNATAQLDQLHNSGMMSDEIYAQAMASMRGATPGSDLAVNADELDLLQRGEPAPATILALPKPSEEASPRLPIRLEVHPATGPPYQVDCTILALHPGGELTVGGFLPVRIDPDDPKHVVVDWSRFGV
jgi:hypothetical protein